MRRYARTLLILPLLMWVAVVHAQEDRAETNAGQTVYKIIKNATNLKAIREEIDQWDQSVRGFRSQHNFTVMAGYISGTWHFKRYGKQVNTRHKVAGVLSKFNYTYHISIYRGFGYFLGSSAGVWLPYAEADGAEIHSAVMFPGVLGGAILNVSPGFRLGGGIDYYLERWSRLSEEEHNRKRATVSITSRVTDLFALVDVFYKLKWAIRCEYHLRRADYKPVKFADGKAVDAVIAMGDQWFGLGVVYHLM